MANPYIDRRDLMKALAIAGTVGLGTNAATPALAQAAVPGAAAKPPAPPFHIGMIIFDGMTNLDFAGPNQVFGAVPGGKIHVLAKTMDPIRTDTGHHVNADMLLKDAPDLDLLFIGGGGGTTPLMEDQEMLDFLVEHAAKTKWITSVCTGTLVLGAAGLLRGYKATTHWTAMEALPLMGATPISERVVIDGNRITGGGVTAGIDFGLTILGMLWGRDVAERMQLVCEYDPQPPYDAGLPTKARPEIVQLITKGWKNMIAGRIDAARRAGARFGSL